MSTASGPGTTSTGRRFPPSEEDDESESNNSSSGSEEEEEGEEQRRIRTQQEQIYIPNDDYKSFYLLLQKHLEEESFDVSGSVRQLYHILHIIYNEKQSPSEKPQVTPEHVEYLLNEGLPGVVRELLARRYLESGKRMVLTLRQVNEFLQCVLEFIVPYIRDDGPFNLLETLRRIFDDDRFFYMQSSNLNITDSDDDDDDDEDPTIYAQLPPQRDDPFRVHSMMPWQRTSPLLIRNVNVFGRRNGFHCIIERLKNTNSKVSIARLKVFLKIFYQLRDMLVLEVKEALVPDLQKSVFNILLNLTENELRALEKNDFEEINKLLQLILERTPSYENKVHEMMERFCLDFAFKCFRSPLLEKRMHGLAYIEEVLQLSDNREHLSYAHQMEDYPYPGYGHSQHMHSMIRSSKWVDSKFMVGWLSECKIIEELFTLNPHTELIKRSSKILIFLAQKGSLTKEYIDLIWSATVGKHESIVNAILEAVTEASFALQDSQLEYFLKKITDLSLHEYNSKLVSLISDLAKSTTSQLRGVAVDLLWNLTLDENSGSIKPDIQSLALAKMIKLLDSFWLRSRRADLTAIYLTTIKSGTSVLQSLQLLRHILDRDAEREQQMMNRLSHYQEESRRSITAKLDKEMGLTDILLHEAVEYKEKASKRATELTVEGRNLDTEQLIGGLFSHIDHVKGRLDFLMYIISNSDIRLSAEQLDIIWQQFVLLALTQAEQEVSFGWFVKFAQIVEDIPTIHHVFQEKLSKLSFSSLSLPGLRCFIKYFVTVNKQLSMMSPQEEVIEFSLVGFEALWKIPLEVDNVDVFTESVDFIIRLYQKVSKDFNEDRAKSSEGFIHTIMTILQEAVKVPSPKQGARIDKCITMLKVFLDQSKPVFGVPQHDRGQILIVNVKNSIAETKPSHFAIKMHTNDPVSLLRHKVGQMLDMPADVVTLCIPTSGYSPSSEANVELSDDKMLREYNLFDKVDLTVKKYTPPVVEAEVPVNTPTEEELEKAKQIMEIFNLPENAAIVALRRNKFALEETVNRLVDEQFLASVYEEASRMAPPAPKKKEVVDVISPSFLLVNNQVYFNLLFELLNVDSIDRQKVWDILMKLPSNQRILDQLHNLSDATDWESLFPSQPAGIYVLLYSLQVLDSLLGVDNDSKEQDTISNWCKDFLRFGGFAHVFKVFTGMNINEQHMNNKAWKAALALLLKIIDFFIKGDVSILPSQAKNEIRHSGETLKKSIDFPSFITLMIKMIWDIARYKYTEAMNPAVSVLVVCLTHRSELLRCFFEFPDIQKFVLFVLSEVMDPAIRRDAAVGLYQLCAISDIPKGLQHPHLYFLNLLLDNIPEATSTTCEQYFDLLNNLIKDSCRGKEGGSSKSFKNLLDVVITRIKERPVIETNRNGTEDRVLVGLMSIVKTLVSQELSFKLQVGSSSGYAMVKELYEYLFALPSEQEFRASYQSLNTSRNKCKTHASRSMALSLLAELAKDCPVNFVELIKLLKPHHAGSSGKDMSFDNPKIFEKAQVGYVGMKNLGSTCYVNSLMQQFFMIPQFRAKILSLDLEKQQQDTENLLRQIQIMFAYLYDSERQYYNPSTFCKAFKDWEGNSINTSLQQDVLEFFNILCDHMENLLKVTPEQRLLDSTFTGTLSQEFICKDCPHYSETTEPFYTISVDIKGKKNLVEALKSFVEGEILEGESAYSCESCKKKVKALKRYSIKKMSSTLIVHLKRFEYVIDRQSNNKLSDYFEFPLRIDMEPYTKEGVAKEKPTVSNSQSSEYELAGILVHSGSADSGHYYSFIKERSPEDPRESKWFRFDDTQVTPFNISNIPEECYGGMQMVPFQVGYHTSYREQTRMKNAYMLFYERVNTPQTTITQARNKELLKRIKEENHQLLRDRQLFDPEYFQFLREVVSALHSTAPQDISFDAIQLGTYFVFETLIRVREESSFVYWMTLLKKMYANNPAACKWFLDLLTVQQRGWFRYLLLECYDDYVRTEFAELVLVLLRCLSPHEYKLYFDMEEKPGKPGEPPVLESKASVIRFMDNMLSYLEFTRQHWRRFTQYFYLLRDFGMIGPYERLYLTRKHVVGLMVDYYMGPFSPNLRPGQQRTRIGDTNSPADLKYFMMVMAIGVRSHATDGSIKSGQLPPTAFEGNSEFPPLPDEQKRLLFNKEFFGSLIKQGYHVESTRDVVAHWTFEDMERTQWMLEIIMDLICRANWNACDNLFAAFEALLAVHDSIELWRVEVALNLTDNGMMDIINHYKDRYPKFTQTCIKFVTQLMYELPLCAAYLYYTRKDWWTWLEPHLKSRIAQQPTDAELAMLHKQFQDFLTGKFSTKFKEDYTNLWKPPADKEANAKYYRLMIQKF